MTSLEDFCSIEKMKGEAAAYEMLLMFPQIRIDENDAVVNLLRKEKGDGD